MMDYRSETFEYKQFKSPNGGYVNRWRKAIELPHGERRCVRFYGSNQKNKECLTSLKEGLITDEEFAGCYREEQQHIQLPRPHLKPAHKR